MILMPERTHHKPFTDYGIRNTNLIPKIRILEFSMQNQPLKQTIRIRYALKPKNSEFCKYSGYLNHLQESPE